MRKKASLLCSCLLLCALLFAVPASAAPASEKEARVTIEKSFTDKDRIRSLKTAPMCGGTAAVVNDMADYWIFEGKAYAANGAAMGLSAKAPLSPPSVTHAGILSALAGEAMQPGSNLGLYYAAFLQGVQKSAEAAKLPLKKDGYLDLKLTTPGGLKARVTTKESCGMLTKVTVVSEFRTDHKDNALTMRLLMDIVPRLLAPDVPKKEYQDALGDAVSLAAKNKGKLAKFSVGTALYQVIYLEDGKGKGRFGLEVATGK